MRIIIVGGVAGGASAATRARRLSEEAEIVVVERGPDISFANCGMPYYIGGEIENRDKLLVASPQLMKDRYNIEVRHLSRVEEIKPDLKKVRIVDLKTNESYWDTYDKLILSPGASPFVPPVPGIDLPGIYTLRNLQDMDRIKEAVTSATKRAVVIGGGFIGLELVENFHRLGIRTTLIERNPQLLPPFDREMTSSINETILAHEVELYLNDNVESFTETDDGLLLTLKSGAQLNAELVVVGVGVRPENKLALEAGLTTGDRGGIKVNEYMQTSNPDIYAVGDVVETKDFISETPAQVPLAGPANRQGRIAANHLFGHITPYRGTQGTAILRVFDKVAAITGASEKGLQRLGIDYEKIYLHPAQHVGYYPGASQMTIKVLFAPEASSSVDAEVNHKPYVAGQILGAQIVGGEGVDKKIDTLATCIQAGMTMYDLEELELAYSPQFGAAKDALNMAGFIGAGVLLGDHPVAHYEKLTSEKLTTDNPDQITLIDVRTPAEFEAGTIPNAVNIPLHDLRERLQENTNELPKDKPIYVFCQVGMRGYLATRILLMHNYDVYNLSGGYLTYKQYQEKQHSQA